MCWALYLGLCSALGLFLFVPGFSRTPQPRPRLFHRCLGDPTLPQSLGVTLVTLFAECVKVPQGSDATVGKKQTGRNSLVQKTVQLFCPVYRMPGLFPAAMGLLPTHSHHHHTLSSCSSTPLVLNVISSQFPKSSFSLIPVFRGCSSLSQP